MSHLLKLTEWQGATLWYCADIEELGRKDSGKWWHIPRMLNLPLIDYILLLKDKYKAEGFQYSIETDTLVFGWKKQSDMRIFKNAMNAAARKANFKV